MLAPLPPNFLMNAVSFSPKNMHRLFYKQFQEILALPRSHLYGSLDSVWASPILDHPRWASRGCLNASTTTGSLTRHKAAHSVVGKVLKSCTILPWIRKLKDASRGLSLEQHRGSMIPSSGANPWHLWKAGPMLWRVWSLQANLCGLPAIPGDGFQALCHPGRSAQTTSCMAVGPFLYLGHCACRDPPKSELLFLATSSHPLGKHWTDPQGLIIQELSFMPHILPLQPFIWPPDLLNLSPPLYICPNQI